MTQNVIFIDGSYYIFYRVFALVNWWKFAKKDEELGDPYENEAFVKKFKETFISKIKEIPKKLKIKDATIYIGKDCKQSDIWRTQIYGNYKSGRNEEKNEEANIKSFFKMVYDEDLFKTAGAKEILEYNHLEADDCIAISAKYMDRKYDDINIYIITSDHDYIQISKDNIHLYDLKYKSLLDSKKYCGCPEQQLFYKIIMGDKSDNISPVFKKCGVKTAEKYYLNPELFKAALIKENVSDKYDFNKVLIDFNNIPNNLLTEFIYKYRNIL